MTRKERKLKKKNSNKRMVNEEITTITKEIYKKDKRKSEKLRK